MPASDLSTSTAVRSFLEAVEARDIDAVLAHFTVDAIWRNMPHEPAVGHDGIRAMLLPILERSSEVRWDVVTESYAADSAWVERVDRFLIDGTEYAVECNGVFTFDADGRITSLRDYVDLGEWRSRLAAVSF